MLIFTSESVFDSVSLGFCFLIYVCDDEESLVL